MLYAIIDTQAHTLAYASAGAPSPVCGVGREEKTLDSAGVFLGISPTATYETRTVSLPPEGFVFLYSDALIESPTPAGQPLEEEGLLHLVHESRAATPDAPLEGVLERFFRRVSRLLPDDLTAVWITRAP